MQIAPGNTSWDPLEPILWPFWDVEDVPGPPFSRLKNNLCVFLYKTTFSNIIWEKTPTSHTDFLSLRHLKYSFNTILTLFWKTHFLNNVSHFCRSIGRSPDGSFYRSIDVSIVRWLDRSIARSIARSLARSLGRSLDRSIDWSLDRSIDRYMSCIWTLFEHIWALGAW